MKGDLTVLMLLLRNQGLKIKVSRESSSITSFPLRICHCCSSEPLWRDRQYTHTLTEEHDGAQCQLSSSCINHQEQGDRCLLRSLEGIIKEQDKSGPCIYNRAIIYGSSNIGSENPRHQTAACARGCVCLLPAPDRAGAMGSAPDTTQTQHSFPAGVTGEGKGTYSDMVLPLSPWGIELVRFAKPGRITPADMGTDPLGSAACRDVVS